ncbi:MFS transporter, DHA1 family, bicyclomycin/chloramphenicol resistance protein [Rhizoctonia solani]|uniref:MFS transporter, DHA1 family, bicyclomycin/chloramphenicol resistance protein n=1 Tax=Rhizoctonia solani TaxID=456999 RepID=A0A0K6FTJ4_9AGAM|nr:MFS transporter, DHA1 family, bicyclomycin/chloramphenicol resistance protein [Rhizoctonia solani]
MSQNNSLSRAAVQGWEEADSTLSNALKPFLESCSHLEAFYVPEGGNLDSLISRIDSTLDLLTQSRSLLSRMRNRTRSPLCRLPEDILIKIFLEVIFVPTEEERAGYPEMESAVRIVYQRMHSLNRVCTAWRNVLNCKAAWHVVPIMHSEQKLGRKLVTDLSLQRAGSGFHLAVIKLYDWTSNELKILAEHAHRFSSANIRAKSPADVEVIIKAFLESRRPAMLSKLDICHIPAQQSISSGRYRFHSPQPYVFSEHSNLQGPFTKMLEPLSVLCVSGVLLDWRIITFSGRLTELYLHGVHIGDHSHFIAFLQAASSAPELEHLSIISVATTSNTHPLQPASYSKFTFPKLQSLRLGCLYSNVLGLVLGSISPGSHRLSLHLNENSLVYYVGKEAFKQSCRVFEQVALDTLELDSRDCPRLHEHLASLLKVTPHLKVLKLSHWRFNETVWDVLTRPAFNDTPFPNLEELHLSAAVCSPSNLAAIKRMVQSHSIRKMVIGVCVQETETPTQVRSSHLDQEHLAETLGADVIEWLVSAVPEVHLGITRVDPPEFRPHWWGLW